MIELERDRDRSYIKYQEKILLMKNATNNSEAFAKFAQEANDAWLEYKKKDVLHTNYLVLKQMGELYGCQEART